MHMASENHSDYSANELYPYYRQLCIQGFIYTVNRNTRMYVYSLTADPELNYIMLYNR